MKRPPLPVLIVGAAGVALALGLLLLPRADRDARLSGYVEAERLMIAAPISGAVRSLAVEEGEVVDRGAPLFAVDPAQSRADLDRAEAGAAAAAAQAADAGKGDRPIELAVLDAQVDAARARDEEARRDLARVRTLAEKGVYAPARLETAQAAARTAAADLRAAQRRRDGAELGARSDQQTAAQARVTEAQASVRSAQARLSDLAPAAPEAAVVEEVFYRPGEWVPANQPVLALASLDRLRIRFFVPQDQLHAYRPGLEVRFECDGCAGPQRARITRVSPRAEFTPPVIYSRDSRERLVFMVEAKPDARLPAGLPVDVEPLRTGRPQ